MNFLKHYFTSLQTFYNLKAYNFRITLLDCLTTFNLSLYLTTLYIYFLFGTSRWQKSNFYNEHLLVLHKIRSILNLWVTRLDFEQSRNSQVNGVKLLFTNEGVILVNDAG